MEALLLVLAGAVLCLLLLPGSEALRGPPRLGPVMAEVDGVHPARAVQALRDGWRPGVGFLDKYPVLGSALFGLVVTVGQPDVPSAEAWLALPRDQRRLEEWRLSAAVEDALAAQRQVSRLAMALAVGVALALAAQLLRRAGVRNDGVVRLGAAVTAVSLGAAYPVAYYASTANVDALAFLPALLCLWASLDGSHRAAAVAAALATAVKDPAFVLGPVVLLGAWTDARPGRARRTLGVAALGLGVYAVATGAICAPSTWWQHASYLLSGGVQGVERIDPSDPSAWPQLLGYAGHLVLGAQGLVVAALGLLGLAWGARRDGAGVARLLLAVALTLALFVVPVGFVYARFLLVPMAVLAVGAGVAGALLVQLVLERVTDDARGRLVAVAVLIGGYLAVEFVYDRALADGAYGRAPHEPLAELTAMVEPGVDPREHARDFVAERVAAGGRVVLVADAREAGPPVDPRRVRYEVLGLDQAPHALQAWHDDASARPDLLLMMNFPTEPPSGRPADTQDLLEVGEVVGESFRVVARWGAPHGGVVERSLAIRPVITALEPLP